MLSPYFAPMLLVNCILATLQVADLLRLNPGVSVSRPPGYPSGNPSGCAGGKPARRWRFQPEATATRRVARP
jgi:hypothetical protein